MRIDHILPPDLLRHRAVRVLVIGAGGTGSAIVLGLPYLDQALRAWGHGYGLEVTMMDGDLVSETNCVRQPFSISDIGQNKSTVLINRINLFWGTRWQAIPTHFHVRSFDRHQDRCPDLVIGCVDTRAGRRSIAGSLSGGLNNVCYWLDLGNNAASGQYVLGQPLNTRNRRKRERLRTVPNILSQEEVTRLINASSSLFQRTLLMVLYGTGMRRAELARLKIADIDSQRMVVHVVDGKGHKDRDLPLSPALLESLRAYWRWLKPRTESDPASSLHGSGPRGKFLGASNAINMPSTLTCKSKTPPTNLRASPKLRRRGVSDLA